MQTAPALVIFSGLPGSGKSTLAGRLARERRWPLLCIDDVASRVPADADTRFWDDRVLALLNLAETQLAIGLDLVIDSVFMRSDRLHAQELARRYGAAFRPVYCLVSNEAVWEQRVTRRFEERGETGVASWERVLQQRTHFQPWQPGSALFVDALEPPASNYAAVLDFVTRPQVNLKPLPITRPLVKGRYHDWPPE